MDWTRKEPVTFFLSRGKVNRRAELKKRLSTVVVAGTKSRLVKLTSKASTSAEAYALFEEEPSGRLWAAAVITKVDGNSMSYALFPEWENPPYYDCGGIILRKLMKSRPSEHPAAEEWRRRCRADFERNESPAAFKKLAEGARIVWTVGDNGPSYLPRGSQIILEKAKVHRRWCWRDIDNGLTYSDEMIPEDERQLLGIQPSS